MATLDHGPALEEMSAVSTGDATMERAGHGSFASASASMRAVASSLDDLDARQDASARGALPLRLATSFFESLARSLRDEVGHELAAESLYEIGRAWGERVFARFVEATEHEYGSIHALPAELFLVRWWWNLQQRGFGTCSADFVRRARGVVLLECRHAPFAAPCIELYAGLFAATFSQLAGRSLASVLLPSSSSEDSVHFVVTTPERAASAKSLRDQGASADEVLAECERSGT